MQDTTTRRSVRTALGAAAILALAACSGGGEDGGTSSQTEATSGQTVSASATKQATSPASTTADGATSSSVTTSGSATSSSSPAAITATSDAIFASPSGNISCLVGLDGVRCDILERGWEQKPADKLTDCEFDQGPTLVVDDEGARFGCVSDTILKSRAEGFEDWAPRGTAKAGDQYALAYGQSLSRGDFTCESTQSGVTCTDVGEGDQFFISQQSYRITNR